MCIAKWTFTQSITLFYVSSYYSVSVSLVSASRLTDIVHKQGFADVSVDESSPELDGTGGWPFRHFVEQLIHDMFDPSKFCTVFCSFNDFCNLTI